MIISKVRTYLKNQVIAVDSDFKEHEDAFNVDNIPGTLKNKSFHIDYSIDNSQEFDTHLEDDVSATLTLFFKGYRTPAKALDVAMDLANDIRIKAVSIATVESFKITDDNPIFGVSCLSIKPSPVPTNDNQIIIELEFNLRIAQTIC